MKSIAIVLAISLIVFSNQSLLGQAATAPPAKANEGAAGASAAPADNPASKDLRFQALEKMLTNVALIGMFTVDRKKMSDQSEERYEIKSIQKLSVDDDLWGLTARIKYGKHDVEVPIVLSIKWADKTPVMTMDKMLIPGLGTFSARVVFHDGKYAGTWTHDEHGGHLFGRIEANNP